MYRLDFGETAAKAVFLFAEIVLQRMSPLLAQSGHPELHRTCLLLGAERTWPFALHVSAFDPKRTLLPLRPIAK